MEPEAHTLYLRGRYQLNKRTPAGFRQALGISIIPPYETYVLYEVYITPGLMAMIQLFNGMQSSLSMVYDREMGNMRTMLMSPLPRWFILVACLLITGGAALAAGPMLLKRRHGVETGGRA